MITSFHHHIRNPLGAAGTSRLRYGMARTVYHLVHQSGRGYEVRFVEANFRPRIATGFPTEAKANDWIEQHERFADADDRWQRRAARKFQED